MLLSSDIHASLDFRDVLYASQWMVDWRPVSLMFCSLAWRGLFSEVDVIG